MPNAQANQQGWGLGEYISEKQRYSDILYVYKPFSLVQAYKYKVTKIHFLEILRYLSDNFIASSGGYL